MTAKMDYKVISADDHLDLRFWPADLRTAWLIGASQIPLDDPAAAAKEMERVAKLGSRHVNLMATWADPPIWTG
jgi:hypothetical protein